MKQLWVKTHAPTSFAEFCFVDTAFKDMITSLLDKNDIPHLLFVGAAGTGKSCAAQLLIDHNQIHPSDVLTIDASMDNNVDTVRELIRDFVVRSGFGDTARIVLLEEADRLSEQAQDTLRELMVRYSDDARFILTANREYKITDALTSRCQVYRFKSIPVVAAMRRLITILDKEGIEFDPDEVSVMVRDFLPDLRGLIGAAQQHTVGGKLTYHQAESSAELTTMIDQGNFSGLMTWLTTKSIPSELDAVYATFFKGVLNCEIFTATHDRIDKALVAVAKYQSQHTTSADPTICVAALIAELRQISNS